MKEYGLKLTLERIRTANGTAQHISCAICGIIMASMFIGHVNSYLVIAWGLLSVLVIFATIWLPRLLLKYTLLADFFLSMLVLFQYVLKPVQEKMVPVYHIRTINGMEKFVRPSFDMHMTPIDQIAHSAALVWLAVWSLYLANLAHRQILEHKRFTNDD